MPWSLEQLRSFSLRAADGAIGHIRDVLFDDREWTVRYFVVDTGKWLPGRKVLISTSVLETPDGIHDEFPVNLTREQVRNSPDIDAEKPVSRQREIELQRHYGWNAYWGGTAVPPFGTTTIAAPGAFPLAGPQFHAGGRSPGEAEPERESGDPHLRSGREIEGYAIGAQDGDIGTVEDLLISEHGWQIRWMVVDTGNWLPGRKVILAPEWVSDISWSEERVIVDLTREQVRHSPEFNPLESLEQGHEGQIYAHYGRTPYWE